MLCSTWDGLYTMAFSSNITTFTLSGLNLTKDSKYIFFSMALLAYFMVLFLNLSLAITVIHEKTLHEPMYIFLCNLCINGIYGTSGFYPKFLLDIISDSRDIPYSGCLLQVFVIYSSVTCDFTTLTAMAYDRTVAICQPLEYHSIMTTQAVVTLLIFCWLHPLFCSVLMITLTSLLSLCGSHIDKLYCDNWSIVRLSCVPATTLHQVLGFLVVLSFMAHAIFILYSYKKLITACRNSKEDKLKFMQTCVPHLVTITIFSISVLFDTMYSRYGSKDTPQSLRDFMSLELLIIPPLFNPIIYGLKLTELRRRIPRPYKRLTAAQNSEPRRRIRRKIIFSS
ncbi:olfactory receptor 4E1-like isoform X2 [Anguilla anguilla]|uniref:olfactory receptor 4E1-like isoform X2 n=1 Tax=Anguilla anguilla TaxID=7936 RepID=UPI0015A888DE|nr:olfactory receptor 4E1-like isoform X2 [Anguilla anguilla]